MTRVTFLRQQDGLIVGFLVEDHADFDDYGKDVVCAGISALTINAINSIEVLTEDTVETEVSKDPTKISCMVSGKPSDRCETILGSLELGLKGIAAMYDGYLEFQDLEV